MKESYPIVSGVAYGGPYCGLPFRTVLPVVPIPGGNYERTDETTPSGLVVFRFKSISTPSHLK